jgi:hypothetical protein
MYMLLGTFEQPLRWQAFDSGAHNSLSILGDLKRPCASPLVDHFGVEKVLQLP